jgi:uncharacterized protein YndB with AHSA1/START domain
VTTDVKTNGSSVVSLEMDATPEEIFAVLADGYSYDDWVVGAKQIRAVDADWPAKGSQFHHEIGVGPIDIKDSSKVIEVDQPNRLVLSVRFRPAGTAVVELIMDPIDSGKTRVTMKETPTSGAARSLALVTSMMLLVRNEWSLLRLRRLVTAHRAAS